MARKKTKSTYPWVQKTEKKAHTRIEIETRYNSGRWRRTSKLFLEKNPLCQVSETLGEIKSAYVTDHVHPVKFGGEFWNEENYQAMSRELHDKKSGFEAHLMGMMRDFEMDERRSAYEYLVSNSGNRHLFLIDFELVKNLFFNWKAGRGYGVKSLKSDD